MCRRIASMMRPLLFIKSNRTLGERTLRLLCGRSQKTFRFVGFYEGVDLLEGDHTLGSKK